MESIEKAKYAIEHNLFMTIASADANGKPWSTPVGFAYDNNFNFYWVSSKDARHSLNIIERPTVCLSIFGKMPEAGYEGVYIDATAAELTSVDEIQFGINLFKMHRPQPPKFATDSINDVTGDANWRMYKAVPHEVFKRSETTINYQTVTVRQPVRLTKN